ncbi:hypothetical protein [Pseudonocardia sp. H11422]|uniref:hypothetical protein n=1 Tax=Pseudonocardia sp. H11422 TaxID=2835866 RepID=UPI001BDC7C4D|nr:hypothetical protein [Pseudonocardia sp. H11422]
MGVVAALLRLRLPRDVARTHAEALVLTATATHLPDSSELNVIPELTQRQGGSPVRLWTYSLLLRAPVGADQLVRIAGTAADRAVRAEYGAAAGAHAMLAPTAEQLATCRRAVAGTPAQLGWR